MIGVTYFSMPLWERASSASIILGLTFIPLTFAFSGSTAALCTDVGGIAYDVIEINLGSFRITEVNLSGLRFFWYDGCNTHVSSLIPVLLGIWMIGFGIYLRGRIDRE